jgi:hypothetical protein
VKPKSELEYSMQEIPKEKSEHTGAGQSNFVIKDRQRRSIPPLSRKDERGHGVFSNSTLDLRDDHIGKGNCQVQEDHNHEEFSDWFSKSRSLILKQSLRESPAGCSTCTVSQ